MHNVNRFVMMMNQVPKIIIFVCFLFVEIISQINILSINVENASVILCIITLFKHMFHTCIFIRFLKERQQMIYCNWQHQLSLIILDILEFPLS